MTIQQQLSEIFTVYPADQEERRQLTRLMELFYFLPQPPDPWGMHSQYLELREAFRASINTGDDEQVESAFLQLYCNAHGYEAPYTLEEREQVDKTGGYWCHSGGISPLLKARHWIKKDTISADFGAGNGLQGLLLQWLYPHKQTVQIEISSKMVTSGKELQKWLGIPEDRIGWICDDVMNQSARDFDFIYLYRPLKPEGIGIQFYEKFAYEVTASDKPVVIFSIADCLISFLPQSFKVFYHDGHLTCYKKG